MRIGKCIIGTLTNEFGYAGTGQKYDALHGAVGFSPFGDVPAASSSMKGILRSG